MAMFWPRASNLEFSGASVASIASELAHTPAHKPNTTVITALVDAYVALVPDSDDSFGPSASIQVDPIVLDIVELLAQLGVDLGSSEGQHRVRGARWARGAHFSRTTKDPLRNDRTGDIL